MQLPSRSFPRLISTFSFIASLYLSSHLHSNFVVFYASLPSIVHRRSLVHLFAFFFRLFVRFRSYHGLFFILPIHHLPSHPKTRKNKGAFFTCFGKMTNAFLNYLKKVDNSVLFQGRQSKERYHRN
jgi:hypothetical protein